MRVLVSAASKHGSTAEMAAAIAETLRGHGCDVTVAAPDEVTDLDGYDAAVVGSAVYAGQWLPPARELIARLQPFSAMKVWLFSSGPVGNPLVPSDDPAGIAPIVERLGPREHRVFAGRLDKSALGVAERMIVRALHVPEGDYRDWFDVAVWAAQIAGALVEDAPAPQLT